MTGEGTATSGLFLDLDFRSRIVRWAQEQSGTIIAAYVEDIVAGDWGRQVARDLATITFVAIIGIGHAAIEIGKGIALVRIVREPRVGQQGVLNIVVTR